MPKKLDSCVKKVKAKGKVSNPFAVCRASLGTDKEIAARVKQKRKKTSHERREKKEERGKHSDD